MSMLIFKFLKLLTIPFSLMLLLTACGGVYTTPDTIYTTSIWSPPATYTITDGSPTSRSACCSSSNIYYNDCQRCGVAPVAVVQPTYVRPCGGYRTVYRAGCGSSYAVPVVNRYGYRPTCVWGASC